MFSSPLFKVEASGLENTTKWVREGKFWGRTKTKGKKRRSEPRTDRLDSVSWQGLFVWILSAPPTATVARGHRDKESVRWKLCALFRVSVPFVARSVHPLWTENPRLCFRQDECSSVQTVIRWQFIWVDRKCFGSITFHLKLGQIPKSLFKDAALMNF